MNNQVFVPVTDDMVYNHPELIEGPLVPYYVGMECQNWLSIEINPEDEVPLISNSGSKLGSKFEANTRGATKRPKLRLAYSA